MKRGAIELGLITAFVLALILAPGARAGIAYLPRTGPPALRMLVVKSPKAVPAMNIETNTKVAVSDTNCPDIRALNTNTVETVVNSAGDSNPNYGGTMHGIAMGPGNPLEVPTGPTVFASPSQDTTSMTPQILATYFQPLVTGTNGATVAVPFPIGFVPPMAQPDKSSHAEYIIK